MTLIILSIDRIFFCCYHYFGLLLLPFASWCFSGNTSRKTKSDFPKLGRCILIVYHCQNHYHRLKTIYLRFTSIKVAGTFLIRLIQSLLWYGRQRRFWIGYLVKELVPDYVVLTGSSKAKVMPKWRGKAVGKAKGPMKTEFDTAAGTP